MYTHICKAFVHVYSLKWILFYLLIYLFYWSIVDLQCCVSNIGLWWSLYHSVNLLVLLNTSESSAMKLYLSKEVTNRKTQLKGGYKADKLSLVIPQQDSTLPWLQFLDMGLSPQKHQCFLSMDTCIFVIFAAGSPDDRDLSIIICWTEL